MHKSIMAFDKKQNKSNKIMYTVSIFSIIVFFCILIWHIVMLKSDSTKISIESFSQISTSMFILCNTLTMLTFNTNDKNTIYKVMGISNKEIYKFRLKNTLRKTLVPLVILLSFTIIFSIYYSNLILFCIFTSYVFLPIKTVFNSFNYPKERNLYKLKRLDKKAFADCIEIEKKSILSNMGIIFKLNTYFALITFISLLPIIPIILNVITSNYFEIPNFLIAASLIITFIIKIIILKKLYKVTITDSDQYDYNI